MGKLQAVLAFFCLRDCLKMTADELVRLFVEKFLSDTFSEFDSLKMGDVMNVNVLIMNIGKRLQRL